MLHLPETMAAWPWPRRINPCYEEVAAESSAWLRSFKAFSPASQYAFDRCDFEHLRTGCDLMNLFFVIDEYTDVEDAKTCREMVDVIIDALNHPHDPRPEGEVVLGEIARQFWELAIKTASLTSQRHFIESFTAYLNSVVVQAVDREQDTISTVEAYLKNRRENIGSRPSFCLIELAMEIPDEAFYHPTMVGLATYITDLLVLDNDIVSYNKEQSVGDDRHNILTIVMRQFNVDLYGAMAWAVQYHEKVEAAFIDGLKRIPSWGEQIDEQVDEYVLGLANWLRANDCWSFESGRYFGNKGLEVQKTRYVPVLPKVKQKSSLHREQVVVPLVDL
ncbi:terpenoid synthase [Laetiporus sulphureus 93-53]|uniref:Terpene synthase n=1 Tax=Laetiporus sulphureus 93-53 TaxID=1314785 RepID=A0A165BXC3_9APHY|nr:terpenoid synthase [Laetiporus sulphureus 93-53]KZT01823.1 terpenoid synthase [Laetiporus sulphureus 93-53]